ncbi:MAG TPA: hypothetical protein VLA09_05095 [Longimicrobiales bacterium]|nr:hypothetical protein [Longimicrobiales bacterium]
MPQSFSLSKARCAVIADPSLRREILAHTGSEAATSGILRSIDRFSDDAAILRYDITPQTGGAGARSTRAVAWSVRAVRL